MQTSVVPRLSIKLLAGALILSLAIGGGALALLLLRAGGPAGQGAAAPIAPAPSFMLTDQLGRPVSDTDLRGKVVVADFIYTTCTDICPALTAQMASLRTRLEHEGLLGDVVLLSFSVDPARDTPAVLKAYSEPFAADPTNWRFLTGDEAAIQEVVVDGFLLGVEVMEAAAEDAAAHEAGSAHSLGDGHTGGHGASHGGDYEVSHSGRFVLIDRDWQIRGYHDSAELDQDELVASIQTLAR